MLYMLSVAEVALCVLLHAAWQRVQRWLLTTLRCAEEVRHLDSENQVLRSKHDKIVEEHAKTLERIDELWKQKWKINWDGVSVQTDSGVRGVSGYSACQNLGSTLGCGRGSKPIQLQLPVCSDSCSQHAPVV